MVIYWSSEDGCYIAEVPELAGCMADGKMWGEALMQAEVVMQEWLEATEEEKRKIPSPKCRLEYV